MPMPPDTFARLLDAALRDNPGRPFLTAYDEGAGTRTELSVTTYANWVAKTANLLLDDYLLGEGDTVRLALPPHWVGAVFLGACLRAGVASTTDPATPAHLVVRGPEPLAEEGTSDVPVLACSLTPFATRFATTLPDGVDDFGLAWPGQPDAFLGAAEPGSATIGCRHEGSCHTQGELVTLARQARATWTGPRLLTDHSPLQACGTTTLLAALLEGGSLVLVGGSPDAQWPARLEGERATDVLRSS